MSDLAVPATLTPMQVANLTDAELLALADVAAGARLVKDEQKKLLIGFPLIATGATIRDGIPGPDKSPTNYLSVEMRARDRDTITQYVTTARITPDQAKAFEPGEMLVINDGSTGVYRQVMSYLESTGRVQFPDGPDGGEAGASRFDTYWRKWTVKSGQLGEDELRFAFVLSLPRGLRVSEYRNDFGDAATFYIG